MKDSRDTAVFKLTTAILFGFVMVAVVGTTTMITEASAQTTTTDRTFESEDGSFRFQIPQGWVVQDGDFTNSSEQSYETVAMLCLESEALPGIGGRHDCQAGNLTDSIFINRFANLKTMPEFQNDSDSNSTIIPTTNDLLALRILALRNDSIGQIGIENNTDINEFTKIVNMTYRGVDTAGTFLPFDDSPVNYKSAAMFVLSQDRNTGYYIANNIIVADNQTQHSPAVQEVFNSFELL